MPPRSVLPALLLGTLPGVALGAFLAPWSAGAVALAVAGLACTAFPRRAVVLGSAALLASTLRVAAMDRTFVAPGADLPFAGTVVGVRTEPYASVRLREPGEYDGRLLRIPNTNEVSLRPGDAVRGSCATAPLPRPVIRAVLSGTSGSCFRVRFDSIATGEGALRALAEQRRATTERVAALYPQPSSDFLEGLLVGSPPDAAPELERDLRRAGVSHLVAVSGYNLTIVVGVIGSFVLPLLGRRVGTLAIGAGLLAFAGVSGFEPSVLRAGAMAILQLVAYLVGRPAALLRLLGLAVLVTAWIAPALPLFDLGFQLSVAATAGLALLTDPVAARLRVLPPGALRTSAAGATAALIATTPVLLLSVGRVSLVAPLTTVLLTPGVPPAMLLGALSLLPIPVLDSVLAALTRTLLEAMLLTARTAAALPFAAVELPGWTVLLPLAALAALRFRRRRSVPTLPGWGTGIP